MKENKVVHKKIVIVLAGMLIGIFSINPPVAHAHSFISYLDRAGELLVHPSEVDGHNYLTHPGEVYTSFDYNYSLSTQEGYNYLGTQTNKNKGHVNTLTDRTKVGIMNNLQLFIGETYQFNHSDTTAIKTGHVTTGNSRGFSDPTIGAIYRAIDESFPVDLGVSFSPDLINSKTTGGGRDGNIASGRSIVTFGPSIQHTIKDVPLLNNVTFDLSEASAYLGKRTTKLLGNNDFEAKTKPSWSHTFALDVQSRFTDRLSADVGVGYALNTNFHHTNATSSIYTIPADSMDYDAAVSYVLIPTKLVGSLGYTYTNFGKTKNEFANVAQNTTIKNHSANQLGVQMQYFF